MVNGIIVPSLTFFNKDYEIEMDLNKILIRHALLNKANAIYLFGTTGEGIYFSDKLNEKIKFLNLTIEINDKIPILLGAFGNEVDEVTNQIETLGKKFSALNFFIAPPFSKKLPADELKIHFESILDSLSLKNHIYLYHNPEQFAGNEIDPKIVQELRNFENLRGIKDASNKINNYKAYIGQLSENFSVLCGDESRFSFFLQLIPLELRKYAGIVPGIANLTNICSKLYKAALEDNILELTQHQEHLDDIRNKIYDIKMNAGKVQRGLKYAFLYLYKDILKIPIEELNIVSPPLQRELEDITKTRIEATTNYLLNQKLIFQLYSLNKDELYDLRDIIRIFSTVDVLIKQGKIKKIIGPLDGQINTIYRVNFENSQLIFRFRTSKTFQYENIAKEKILFPLLNGTLYPFSSKFDERIKELLKSPAGNYHFDKQNPPIIPVGNLIYYDESKKLIPYIFTVQEYIHGKTLHKLLEQNIIEDFNLELSTSKFINLFVKLGETLGKLHQIKFSSFYENIYEIGEKNGKIWSEIFHNRLNIEIQEAKKNKLNNIEEIKEFFKDNETLIEEENEAVLIHNDFHSKNIIVKDDVGSIKINGIIDFDNWGIGVKAEDFVKITHWDLEFLDQPEFNKAFYRGYHTYQKIDRDFERKIELYSLFWLLKLTNMETKLTRQTQEKKSFLLLSSKLTQK
ncbi:MAG: dihydrodipicolinate synthase family protein [Promethearchaeota archaeon]